MKTINCTHALIPCIQIFYSGYFHPFDKSSDKIIGNSTTEVTPEKEIQISAAIARGLLVNFNDPKIDHYTVYYIIFTVFG